VISSITEAELRFGAEKSRDPEKNHRQLDQFFLVLPVVPFGSSAAVQYARVRAGLERAGTPIGPLDELIAAHGMALGLTVVTDNTGEFERIPGIALENWGKQEEAGS